MKNTESHIEQLLNKEAQQSQAQMPSYLKDKLLQIPGVRKAKVIPMYKLWWVAASIILLVSINGFSLVKYKKSQSVSNSSTTTAYFSHLSSL